MAFPNSLSGHLEELRFPSLRSPDVDSFTNGNGSTRANSSYFAAMPPTNDARGSLQRRFTTDSGKAPLAKPFGAQYGGLNSQSHSQQMSKQQKWEEIQLMKRKAEEQLRLVAMQEQALKTNGEDTEIDTISSRLGRASLNGPVSEPTTPPEYAEGVYSSSRYSRSSRLSGNSIMSPPGFGNRLSQNSSHIASSAGRLSGSMPLQANRASTKSMPGSRRGSDEEENYADALPNIRPPGSGNRYSMPVGSSRPHHRYCVGTATRNGYDIPINTSFLDDTEGDYLTLNGLDLKSPIAQTFAQLQGDDFPTLTSDGSKLSANSAAIDLANQKQPDADWNVGSRYRPGHQSMPHTDSSMYRPVLSNISSPQGDRPIELARRKSQRHSLGVTFEEGLKYDQTPLPTNIPVTRPTSLQTSYSTNDVPTVKKSLTLETLASPTKTQAEQQFHNHNVIMGRIPNGANRQSRELATATGSPYKMDDNSASTSQSSLQASATPFGPTYTPDSGAAGFNGNQGFGYNVSGYNMNGQNGAIQAFGNPSQGALGANNAYNVYGKGSQDLNRVGSGRRTNLDEARFNNVPLESYRGRLYDLCKDQHGCRYLQRKLEDGEAEHVQTIFAETCPYIAELMIDPFGNYLCQKLFEHCTEEQRSTLISTASPALYPIAINQHGTRALQKMIEYLHTDHQIDMIIAALNAHVVPLVKDLNGNHVIQKCLTRLGAERCQFIYDAVARACIQVGTHRHGCCVLQRCIDHAKGIQRAQLIAKITKTAFELVQDPFGNYVVQYILDLNEPEFTRPLCESFLGKVADLSKQKFSSNVIEKCLRTGDDVSKAMLIKEMLLGNELEKMLRDNFANYVVQTALDYADAQSKAMLLDTIRPLLPSIKGTPHGRRIAGKITSMTTVAPEQMIPDEKYSGNVIGNGRAGGRRHIQIVGGGFNGPRYDNGFSNGPAGFTGGSGDSYTSSNPGGFGMNGMNGMNSMNSMNGMNGMNGFGGMPNMAVDVNESPINLYTPQGFGTQGPNTFGAPTQNGFGGFANGQMGNGFI